MSYTMNRIIGNIRIDVKYMCLPIVNKYVIDLYVAYKHKNIYCSEHMRFPYKYGCFSNLKSFLLSEDFKEKVELIEDKNDLQKVINIVIHHKNKINDINEINEKSNKKKSFFKRMFKL